MKRNRKPNVQPPTGLYLDERNGVVVIADYAPDGSFDIHRAVVDERRAVNITAPHLRTVVEAASAHSQFAQISATASESDEQIITSLLETTQQDHGLIGNFTRSPHGQILLTQADELAISQTNRKLETWLEAQQPTHVEKLPYALRVETRARAIARLWHATSNPPTDETVAFLVVGYDDYGVALWSHNAGFAYETEEFFEQGANYQIKLRHACTTFTRLLSADTIHNLDLSPVTRAIISVPADFHDAVVGMLAAERDLGHIHISPVNLSADENAEPLDQASALAIGALLDDPEMPPCDLNIALNEQLEDIRRSNAEQQSTQHQTRAMRAAVASLIPIVAVAAFAIASYGDRMVERARLQARLATEEKISKQLAKENADYESSKTNFATFQSLLNNLIGLRKRQPAMEQLLRDLNQRWPKEQSWFISEINVKGPSVEIKGKTRNEQAVTSFAKSLEFSDGLFTNILAKNNVQGVTANPSLQATLPASNIIEFTVNATYAPLATSGKPATEGQNTAQPAQLSFPKPPAIPLTSPAPGMAPLTGPSPATTSSPQTGVSQ